MTWIKTVRLKDSPELREKAKWRLLYPPEYGVPVPVLKEWEAPERGGGISESHTLIPGAYYHAFALFGELLQPDLPLNRSQQEMIATVVSVINACFY